MNKNKLNEEEYLKYRIDKEKEHYINLYKKSFGIKGIIFGILTLGLYQVRLGMNELRRVGLY
jgi:hypothetical protein